MNNCIYCGKLCKKKGHTQCKSCAVSKRRWKSKLELIKMLGGKCSICGWDVHPAGLQFHHKDPSKKEFTLNSNKLLLKERYTEAEKCELLCACCHLIKHCNEDLLRKMKLL